jgi:type IV pilus assembly protein PilV
MHDRVPTRPRGLALLEALVAMVILGLAVLGVLRAHLRTLADTRASVYRAQGVRLIEDLAERIKTNPEGFRQLEHVAEITPAAPPDCTKSACAPTALATRDIAMWRQAVAHTLPGGQGSVSQDTLDSGPPSGRPLAVTVAWRAAHASREQDPRGSDIGCPQDHDCHVVHVRP